MMVLLFLYCKNHTLLLSFIIIYYCFYLDIQLFNFMNYSALYPLLPSLFDLFDYIPSSGTWDSVMRYYWKEFLDHYQSPMEYQTGLNNIQIKKCSETNDLIPPNTPNNTQTTTKHTKYVFG